MYGAHFTLRGYLSTINMTKLLCTTILLANWLFYWKMQVSLVTINNNIFMERLFYSPCIIQFLDGKACLLTFSYKKSHVKQKPSLFENMSCSIISSHGHHFRFTLVHLRNVLTRWLQNNYWTMFWIGCKSLKFEILRNTNEKCDVKY